MSVERAASTQDAAAQIQQALHVLNASADGWRDADAFLRSVRESPDVWPVCEALLRGSAPSPAIVTFAASTLRYRIGRDWPALASHNERVSAFRFLRDCLACEHVQRAPAALHDIAYGCGFCIASSSDDDFRALMWVETHAVVADKPHFYCVAFSSLLEAINHVSSTYQRKFDSLRSFCYLHANGILADAIEIFNLGKATDSADSHSLKLQFMRSALECIQGWSRFGSKCMVIGTLFHAIRVPELSQAASEALIEAVSYSGIDAALLVSTCDGLTQAAHLALQSSEDTLHHIAEVASEMTEGNADDYLETESVQGKEFVVRATNLLSVCLNGPNESAFLAAAEGWACWAATITNPGALHRSEVISQIPGVIRTVLEKMSVFESLSYGSLSGDHLEEDGADLAKISDLLLHCADLIGLENYAQGIQSYLEMHSTSSPRHVFAALNALRAAGDLVMEEHFAMSSLLTTLRVILDICKTCESDKNGIAHDETAVKAIYVASLTCLTAYAPIMSNAVPGPASNDLYVGAVKCATESLMRKYVSHQGACLLEKLAEGNQKRMVKYLPDLLTRTMGTLDSLEREPAENWVKGLASVASELPSHAQRTEFLNVILQTSCTYVSQEGSKNELDGDGETLHRHLNIISSAVKEINDDEAAFKLLTILQSPLVRIAKNNCGHETIAPSVCKVLVHCLLPTMDDDNDGDVREDKSSGNLTNGLLDSHQRIELLTSCMALCTECFRKSGADGEVCWVEAVGTISPHLLNLMNTDLPLGQTRLIIEQLSNALGCVLDSVKKFTSDDLDQQAQMVCLYLRFVEVLLGCSAQPSPVSLHAGKVAEMNSAALRVRDRGILRKAIHWWITLFRGALDSVAGDEIARTLVHVCGGVNGLTAGMLVAAGSLSSSSRLCNSIADVLLLMSRWAAKSSGSQLKPAALLQTYITAAFGRDDVPRVGLPLSVKQTMQEAVTSAALNLYTLRRALNELSRSCGS